MENKNLHEQMVEILKGLTEEQRERVNACKTPEELIALLDELDVALPDKAMDAVAGGWPTHWDALQDGFHY